MNLAQKHSYWSRWQRAAAVFAAQGLKREQIEAKRHALTEKALGYAKSMSAWKTWKNAEVDKVFAAFAAVYDDANLDAQLDAIEQPELRRVRALAACKALTAQIIDLDDDDPEHDYKLFKYLNAVSYAVCKTKAESCDDRQLQRLLGVLQRRLEQIERKLQREAAKAANDGEPF